MRSEGFYAVWRALFRSHFRYVHPERTLAFSDEDAASNGATGLAALRSPPRIRWLAYLHHLFRACLCSRSLEP